MGTVYAGKVGAISIASTTWAMQEWSLEMSANLLDVTTFAAGGYRVKLAGLVGGRITARGPYDTGSMALTVGASVAVVLTIGGAITFSVTAVAGQIVPSTSVEGFGQVSISLETTGSFTAAIA